MGKSTVCDCGPTILTCSQWNNPIVDIFFCNAKLLLARPQNAVCHRILVQGKSTRHDPKIPQQERIIADQTEPIRPSDIRGFISICKHFASRESRAQKNLCKGT